MGVIGIIKRVFIFLLSVLLSLSLFSNLLILNVSSSLNYNSLSQNSQEIVQIFLKNNSEFSSGIEEMSPYLQQYCLTNSEYVLNLEGFSAKIPCNLSSYDKDTVINELVKSMIHDVYYKDYGCNFLDCFNKGGELPLFLISQKSYDFLKTCFLVSLVISLVLIALIFLLMKKKSNLFILSGVLLFPYSLLFFKLNFSYFISEEIFVKILNAILSKSHQIGLGALILSILLIITGIVFKILKIGTKNTDSIKEKSVPVKKKVKK